MNIRILRIERGGLFEIDERIAVSLSFDEQSAEIVERIKVFFAQGNRGS